MTVGLKTEQAYILTTLLSGQGSRKYPMIPVHKKTSQILTHQNGPSNKWMQNSKKTYTTTNSHLNDLFICVRTTVVHNTKQTTVLTISPFIL